jgi:phosphoribosyl 1,2-cyclic phosphodiesterase
VSLLSAAVIVTRSHIDHFGGLLRLRADGRTHFTVVDDHWE